ILSGSVFAADGHTPLRGYNVRIRLFDGETTVADTTTYTGAYELSDLPDPSSGGTLRMRVNYGVEMDKFIEEPVTVSVGHAVTHHVTVPVGGVVGTVRFWQGWTPQYSTIQITFGDGVGQSFSADFDSQSGTYGVFDLPAGDFVETFWIDAEKA